MIYDKKNEEISFGASSKLIWPSQNELPIVVYAPIPYRYQTECLNKNNHIELLDDIYSSLAECGCTTAIIGLSGDHIEKQVSAAERHNVNVIIPAGGTWGIEHHCFDILRTYMNNKNVVAWFSYDEPRPYQWSDAFYKFNEKIDMNAGTFWNQLTVAYGLTSSLDPTRLSIFNLAAESDDTWAGSFGIPHAEYNKAPLSLKLEKARSYLNNFQTQFHPWIWSYDYYPIRSLLKENELVEGKYEVVNGQFETDYEKFFGYLGLYQKFTQDTQSKYWAYGMCMEHDIFNNKNWDKLNCHYPTPTEGELRFEVFSALLYGAQGISYYRYGLGVTAEEALNTDNDASEKYKTGTKCIMAPISCSINGDEVKIDKSIIWERLKKINGEIKEFQHIFIGCNVMGHKQFKGNSGILYESIQLYKGNTKDIDDCIHIMGSTGKGLLLTSFTNQLSNGKTRHYVAVMNIDPFNTCMFDFTVKKGVILPVKCHIVSSSSVSEGAIPGNNPESNAKGYIRYVLKEGGMFAIYWDV